MKILFDISILEKLQSNVLLPIECKNCKDKFLRPKNLIVRGLKGTRKVDFCSIKCAGIYKTNISTVSCKCNNCGAKLKRKQSAMSSLNYCNSSCAAQISNRKRDRTAIGYSRGGRKSLAKICPNCNGPKSSKPELCRLCKEKKVLLEYGKTLLSVCKSTYARHKFQSVRNHAHRVMRLSEYTKECKICKYSLHIELCHIKGISKFNENNSFNDINSLDNLCWLCPTHHWELDHGLLSLET